MFRQILLTFLFALLLSCGNVFPEPHSLKYKDKQFNEIATFILSQRDIYEMDDFTRHYKSINGVFVKLKTDEGDQDAQFLNIVTDSLKLNPEVIFELRIKLEQSKLRQFIKSTDTILFIVDGFLDNSWGFMYSRRGLVMDSAWFDFKGHSIKFVEEVNSRWKRTAIY
jgi:hypothetical protein